MFSENVLANWPDGSGRATENLCLDKGMTILQAVQRRLKGDTGHTFGV